MEEYLSFDDVLLKPQFSDVRTRSQVDLSTKLGNLRLEVPIISANMDTITGPQMALSMGKVGGLGILHRYTDHREILEWTRLLYNDYNHAIPSIGVRDYDFEYFTKYFKSGIDGICIDVAHGDSIHTVDMVKRIVDFSKNTTTIIAGNVGTAEGAQRLEQAGAHVIKVGIGPGSRCTTREITGHGVPQLSAIMEVAAAVNNAAIIADGGIRNSGDIVKALAAGADAVMIGGLFAGTDETPGEVINHPHDGPYKIYRGMASQEAREDFLGFSVGDDYTPEGQSTAIPLKGPVGPIVKRLAGGIRSGCSYSGAHSLKELRTKAKFVKITPSTLAENNTRIL